MSKLLLTNLTTFKAYFEDIAVQHINIGGFKWGDKEVIKNDNRSNMPDSFLWVIPYTNVRYQGENVDNMTKVKSATIAFWMVAVGTKFEKVEQDFDFCEQLSEEILARINRDRKGSEVDGEWTQLATQLGSYTGAPVEMEIGSTPYRGWELKIEFLDNMRMAFDASKWQDTR